MVDISSLATFQDFDTSQRSRLIARDGGAILAGTLVDARGVELVLDGSGTVPIAQIVSLTDGAATLSGQDYAFPGGAVTLSNGGTADLSRAHAIDGASFWVNDGVTLALPAARSYAHATTANDQTRSLRASGAGSVLDLSNVSSITGGTNWNSDLTIEAVAGGQIDLGRVRQIADARSGELRYGRMSVTADGADSVVDLSALITFQDFDTSERSRLVASGGGTVLAGSLVDVRGVELVLDGTGTLPLAQLSSLTEGAATLSGQDYAFPGLENASGTTFTINGVHADLGAVTNLTRGALTLSSGGTANLSSARTIDGASFWVNDGVTLALPAARSYAHAATANDQTRVLRAAGAGSVLDLSQVAHITGGRNWNSDLVIEALAGGHVDLRAVADILEPIEGETRYGHVSVLADGAASTVYLNGLANFYDRSGDEVSTLVASRGGTIVLASGPVNLVGVNVTGDVGPAAPTPSPAVGETLDGMPLSAVEGNLAPLLLEVTQAADVPGTASWIGLDGDWANPANWSGGRVPGPRDDVLIDVAGFDVTVTIQSGTRIVHSVSSEESLRILGGSLQVSAASLLRGTLAMSPGTALIASGTGATFVGSGVVSADGASLYALQGGRIELPGLTQYAHAATVNDQTYTLRAEGAGSMLDLSGVTQITGGTRWNSDLAIEALAGGQIDLANVARIADNTTGERRYGSMSVTADGPGSAVRLDALTQFQDVDGSQLSAWTVRNGGEVHSPLLTSMSGAALTLDGTGTIPVVQLLSFTDGELTVRDESDACQDRLVQRRHDRSPWRLADRRRQFPGQRRRHADAPRGHELRAYGPCQRPDLYPASRGGGVGLGFVRRDADHGRDTLELGHFHRGLHGRPDQPARRDSDRGQPHG